MDRKITQKLYKDPASFLYDEDFFAYLQELTHEHKLSVLPQNLYVYYVLLGLFCEVNNGGFDQFLTNSTFETFDDLLDCASAFGVPELTELVTDFVSFVANTLARQGIELADFESDEETDAALSAFDDRFYELDIRLKLDKALLKYYKNNFTQKSVTYTAVKEQPSETCRYVEFDGERDLTAAVEAFLSFLSGFDAKWKLIVSDYHITAETDKRCISISDIMIHFPDNLAKTGPMLAFGKVKIFAPVPKEECRTGLIEIHSILIKPSGFCKNEYKMKRVLHSGVPEDSTLRPGMKNYVVLGDFDKSGDPFHSKETVLQAFLECVKTCRCVREIYSEIIDYSGKSFKIKKEVYWKR